MEICHAGGNLDATGATEASQSGLPLPISLEMKRSIAEGILLSQCETIPMESRDGIARLNREAKQSPGSSLEIATSPRSGVKEKRGSSQ